jgi:phosphate transport system substrate-binding protein
MKLKKVSYGTLGLALVVSTGVAQAKPPVVTFNGAGGTAAISALAENLADYIKTPDLFAYVAAGNGAGQEAFLNNDISYLQPISATNPKGYAPGTSTYGTVSGPSVAFAFSNTPLTASQISDYSLAATDGPLIQFPLIAAPIAIAYNASGTALTLTDAQTCGVLSGQITDWNALDPSIAAGTTINVVVPADGSISTYLLTQHLNAVCTAGNSSFPEYPVPVTRFFYNAGGATDPVFPNGLPANFTGARTSSDIASTMTATADSFGYLPPEYTSIAPNAKNTTSLQVAALVNSQNGVAYLPTTANTSLALNNPGPGATDTTPPSTMATAAYQPNWAPSFPQPAAGYPVVGFPMAYISSCYNIAHAPHLIGAIRQMISKNQPYASNDLNEGYVPLQSTRFGGAYTTAINKVFLNDKSGYGLDINDPTTCASYTGR